MKTRVFAAALILFAVCMVAVPVYLRHKDNVLKIREAEEALIATYEELSERHGLPKDGIKAILKAARSEDLSKQGNLVPVSEEFEVVIWGGHSRYGVGQGRTERRFDLGMERFPLRRVPPHIEKGRELDEETVLALGHYYGSLHLKGKGLKRGVASWLWPNGARKNEDGTWTVDMGEHVVAGPGLLITIAADGSLVNVVELFSGD